METRFFEIVTFVRLEQPSKADVPIVVTLSGMTREVRELQFRNAHSSIVVTVAGRMTFCRELHPKNRLEGIALKGERISAEVSEEQL